MFVDCDGKLDLFYDADLLFLPGGALAVIFFVEVFDVVLDLTYGRDGVGRDLYEVEVTLAGHFEGLKRGHNSKVFAVLVDDANLAGTNTFVGSDARL